MKTLADINRTLESFTKKFGYDLRGVEQGSEAWFNGKLGVISSSNASRSVSGKKTDTRSTFLAELCAQVCTGVMHDIDAKALAWGREHEPEARSLYQFTTGHEITQLPFVFMDESFRVGLSPDGIIDGVKGVEFKCPFNSTKFVEFVTADKMNPKEKWQQQFTLWAMGADQWDFGKYDPRFLGNPMKVIPGVPDPEYQKQLADTIPELILDMDKMLKMLGFEFGDQWRRLAVAQKETA